MLYVQYNAEVMIADMEQYHEMTSKFLKLVEKHGGETLGIWRTAVGKREEVTILERYNNMAHFEEVRTKLEQEPLIKELLPKLGRIRTISSKFMSPVYYSPMQ